MEVGYYWLLFEIQESSIELEDFESAVGRLGFLEIEVGEKID